jgi:hypothetical protein
MYRDIHKASARALRGHRAGNVDREIGARSSGRRTLAHAGAALISHAEHEEEFVQPVLKQMRRSSRTSSSRTTSAREADGVHRAAERLAVDAISTERRRLTHRLYLALASFTAEYLQHQAFEELEIAPALAGFVSAEELVAIDRAIVASIPPDQMAIGLSLMLPAMNIDDRTELLGGMKHGAPPPVLAGVQALAQSVLAPSDYAALAVRVDAA